MNRFGWNRISTSGDVLVERQSYHKHAFMIDGRAIDTGAAATGEAHIHPIMDKDGIVIAFTNPGPVGHHQHYVNDTEEL